MLLNKTGQTDQESRKIIGRWLKTNRETEVFEFIKQAITENIIEPVSWITKQLEKQNVSFQEQKKKEIQNKYNGRKEELEEEYRRTHNGEYNETKITNCFYSETEDDKLTNNSLINNDTIILTENNNPINNNPLNSLNNDTINNNIASNNPTNSNNSINNNPTPGSIAYKNKILSKILKPIFHYYGMVYDNEIVTSFCKTLSFYEYDMLKETRDELITEYKTFPKLANWIEKLKDKRTKQNKYAVMPKELKETINHNDNNNKNWLYVKKRIIEDMGINIFNCWFRDISLIEEKQNKVLLSANNSFVSDYIKRNYLNGTKTKLSSGDTIWLRRGLKEYWQEISPEIETIEIKPINEIKLTVGIGQDKPIVNENPAENPSITADNKNPTADKEDKNPSTTEGVKHD
jgi:hypothetical protein